MTRKDAELTRAEETIRREQQQIQEMRKRVGLLCEVMCSVCCDSSEALVAELTLQQTKVTVTPGYE